MKVRNIMFSGFMAAILSATGAHAAISVASQGYVDSKVGDVATSVSTLSTTVSTTYQTKEDAASQHQALQTAIDSKVAQATYDAKVEALEAMDGTFATKASVGDLPQEATATTIVGYIQEKTSGIATSANLEALTNRVTTAEGEIDGLQGSVNTLNGDEDTAGSVKKQIADAIASEVSRSNGAYAEKSIENTVSSQGEKITALESAGYQNADQVSAAINSAVTADNGVVKTAIATATNDMATKTYVGEQDAATLASAKNYADGLNTAMDTRVDTAEGKITALEGAGYQNADQVSAAINSAVTADNGVVKTAIATATNDMATMTYVGEQDAATLLSAKNYAEGQANAVKATLTLLATAEVPEDCLTGTDGSNICVLTMTNTGEFAWTPLTAPAE